MGINYFWRDSMTAKLNTVLQIREKALLQQDQEEPPKPKRPRSE